MAKNAPNGDCLLDGFNFGTGEDKTNGAGPKAHVFQSSQAA
jgi:hypothetical protein